MAINGCDQVRVGRDLDACLQGALSYQGDISTPEIDGGEISLTAEIFQSGFIERTTQLYQVVSLSINGSTTWDPAVPVNQTWRMAGGQMGITAAAGIAIHIQIIAPDGTVSSIGSYTTTAINEVVPLAERFTSPLTLLGPLKMPWRPRFLFLNGGVAEEVSFNLLMHEVVNGLAMQ